MSKSFLNKDHAYYVLTHPSNSLMQRRMDLPRIFFSLLRWVIFFTLALVRLPWFKHESPIHYVSLEKDTHIIIDLTPQTRLKWLWDLLLTLPFVASRRQIRLNLDSPSDKAYIDQLVEKITKSTGPSFDWQHLHLKGVEYLDDALHAYFLEALVKRHGEAAVFTNHPACFTFFSLQTPNGAVLDSVEVPSLGEVDKPLSERIFIICCPKQNQNYLQSLTHFQQTATNIGATVVGFNSPGCGHSKGITWTQHDQTVDTAAQIERLLLLGVNRQNIHIESPAGGGVIPKDVFATLNPSIGRSDPHSLPVPVPNIPDVTLRRPFVLACSGGGGHISAALGIIDKLRRQDKTVIIPTHQAQLQPHHDFSTISITIKCWFRLLFINWYIFLKPTLLGTPIKRVLHVLGFPDLPHYKDFQHEITQLRQAETWTQSDKNTPPTGRQREYVDMVLDLQMLGYESAAIFNSFQRNDQTSEIDFITQMQEHNDQWNHEAVYHGLLRLFKQAAENNEPFTEIISTQAQSLTALCEAVITYNEEYLPHINQDKRKTSLVPLTIHQYMTDLPTRGATHFLQPLSRLTTKQKQQMELYAVAITPAIYASYLDNGDDFKQIHNLSPHENPMVRAGFLAPDLQSHYLDTSVPMTLSIKTPKGPASIAIPPNSKVASIMLGALATRATTDYVKYLLDHHYDSIFVFGGLNNDIYDGIERIINGYPSGQQAAIRHRIVRLGNQPDKEMAPIMTRSDCVIIRSGGLTTMEQMALPQRKNKAVLIHHKDDQHGLSSGLSWENGNADHLISYLTAQGVFARKTSLKQAPRDLRDAARHETLFTQTQQHNESQEERPTRLPQQADLSSTNQTLFYHHSTSDTVDNPTPEHERPCCPQ